MEAAVGAILGAGWAAGINLYATVLLLGFFGRLGLGEVPEVLQSPWVLGIAAGMYLLEFVTDKIPFVDTVWDIIHTVVRPVGAALVGGEIASEADLSAVFGGGVSGATALGAHLAKSGLRVAINTSPEPVTNIGVSLFEDITVAGMIWFVISYPIIAGIAALVLLAVGVMVLMAAWQLIQRGRKRFRQHRAHRKASSYLR